jgi:hypothetical protein
VLLGIKRIMAAYSDKEIANYIVIVIDSFGIVEILGVFIVDNAKINDTV